VFGYVLSIGNVTANVDWSQPLEQLRAVRDAGVTVLLTTHLMEEAEHCTRLAIMAAGKLLACDTPAALKQLIGGDVITIVSSEPERLQAALRERLGAESERMGDSIRLERDRGHEWVPRIIEAAPGLVDSIAVGKPTLEDVFIHLTGRRFAVESDAADLAKPSNRH
jgi:ABC-2 type transport system ATP-binding protein